MKVELRGQTSRQSCPRMVESMARFQRQCKKMACLLQKSQVQHGPNPAGSATIAQQLPGKVARLCWMNEWFWMTYLDRTWISHILVRSDISTSLLWSDVLFPQKWWLLQDRGCLFPLCISSGATYQGTPWLFVNSLNKGLKIKMTELAWKRGW